MTVYCSGTVRKKQFSFFNFEMNKFTTAEKIKIKISKFLPFSGVFGGDPVKQLNKFVWPNGVAISSGFHDIPQYQACRGE